MVGRRGRCVRTRTVQTRAESLRREGARQHEDVRFKVLAGRPLANLRHVIGECPATPQRQQRVAKIAQALGALHDAVPRGHGEVSEYHALTLAARVTLQARDGGVLSEQQWEHVDRILSAFLPDIARTHSDAKERRAIIDDVVYALIEVTDRAAQMVQEWQRATRWEVDRRAEQERKRGLLRVIVRAWREVADGQRARSLRSATDRGIHAHVHGRMPTDVLSGVHTSFRARLHKGLDVTAFEQRRRDLCDRELKCEGGNALMPYARSALPSWSLARVFLTHVRLVEGGRLDARRKASMQGVQRRQLARRWRVARMAHEQGVGFAGERAQLPSVDPLLVDVAPPPSKRLRAARQACRRADGQADELPPAMTDEGLWEEVDRRLRVLRCPAPVCGRVPVADDGCGDGGVMVEPEWLTWIMGSEFDRSGTPECDCAVERDLGQWFSCYKEAVSQQ